jgi:hypothetical protein
MDLEVLANLSWREALIAIVALLVLYVLVVFWRISRIKRGQVSVAPPVPLGAKSAVAAYSAVQDPEARIEPEPLAAPSEAPFPWNEPPPAAPGQAAIDALEREVAQLRKEVGSLRAEVMVLREEKQRALTQVNVAPSVSPLYSDAMQMALQGHDAATISQHCGISRAEADLVIALGKNKDIQ